MSLELSPSEWVSLSDLEEILEPFANITLEMSKADMPTLSFALPFYELMEKHLSRIIVGRKASNPVLTNAAAGRYDVLKKYYDYARQNQNYSLATSIWSSFFRERHDYGAEDRAHVLFEHVYDEYKKRYQAP
ncbi:hypothetical protein BS47DRAFT_1397521 [Hydnum rufescens UP504]|uniref:Uncharacterized protein n=1 Tax=Hydnum rufescens UP504 TaxID=1448309 RepID=A0A9P6AN34_9AGAM|nr:hypothetical protein BS47DRAFT_1397521 [Hydnum rufescens UP504]